MQGEQEAILVRTPQAAGATRAVTKTAFTSASTTAVATGTVSLDIGGYWMTFLPTQDCHIVFGESTVGAATTSHMLFKAGVSVALWCTRQEDTHYRVIRDTVDGDLYAYRSG